MKFGWLILGALWLNVPAALAFEECGALKNAYGPYDYWVDKDRINIVEIAHMRPEDVKGRWGGGLDYTLRAIPNHPAALMALVQMSDFAKQERLGGMHWPVECYFNRALRFRPNDGTARMIYANYLAKRNRNAEAITQLEKAQEQAGESANLQYNIGLAYFEMREYEKALSYAHKAYDLGFQLPGLRHKLERVGKWRDPVKPAPAPEAAAGTGAETAADASTSATAGGAAGPSSAPAKPGAPDPAQPGK